MIKTTTREIASSSDVNAPVFYFKEYVRGLEYHNNGRQIDFVTDGNSLYVPSTDNITACKDSIKEDGGFMRLVSEGKQGIQGLKGDPGRDGRTPSVFARFDGRQMIFYTNEINEDGTPKTDDKGNPVTRRIAATNDLTGPSWKPKRVDDTIIWEKTRDDSQPESINLSDFVKETAPVIFRVDSDNTKRSDETSGPANYIQWKYEGDEYWNNLISISELMNLALAGVCIWFDETDQEYHLGHRQVLHVTYDSSKSGKRIISDVEHGDVLYDAGPIHLPDFEADIAALWEEVCALKDRVDAIEEELPKFVKAVIINNKLNRPDEDGIVDLGDLDFYTKEESDERFQPKGDYQPAGNYLTPDDLDFELEKDDNGIKLYVTIKGVRKEIGYTCDCKHGDDPVTVPVTGVTITNCVNSIKVGSTGTIIWKVSPDNATDKSVSFTSSNTSVATVSSTGVVTAIAAGTATITVKTTDGNYTATCNVTVTNDEPTPTVIPVDYVRILDNDSVIDTYTMYVGDTHCFTARVYPENATNKNVVWSMSNQNATVTNSGCVTANSVGTSTLTVRSVDRGETYSCVITILERDVEPTTYTVTATAASCDPTITVDGLSESATTTSWKSSLTFDKDTTTHTVFVKATREGHKDRIIECTASESNSTLTVPCDGWTKEKYTLTINSSNIPSGYSINVGTDVVILTNNTWEKQYEYGTEIVITAEASGYISTINPNNFNMTKNTSVNIDWTPGTVSVTGVSLNNSSMSLNIPCNATTATGSLTATVYPNNATNKTVSWKSSDTAIATVDNNGNVKAIKAGTAKITVTTSDGGKTANCLVTVTENTNVSSISVIPTSKEIIVGKTDTLSADVTPSCAYVSWSSDDPNIVSVQAANGRITAKAVGSTKIWASAGDNNKKAYCTVTVKSAAIDVTSVEITDCGDPIRVDETTTLGVTVKPDNATNKDVTWSSNNTAIATVDDNGVVTGASVGKTIIRVTSKSNPNVTNTCEVTVTSGTISVTGVSLDKSPASLTYASCLDNDILKLTATVTPNNATNQNLSWKSSEPGVASIVQQKDDYCTIKPNGVGNSTITVTTEDGGYTATCLLTVTAAEVPIENLYFINSTVELGVGETQYVAAVKTPSCATSCDNIGFTSSNPSVVSFTAASDGYRALLTGVSAGTAVITAACGNTSARCTVTVTASTPTKATIHNDTGVTIYVDCPGDGSEDWILTNGSSHKFEFGTGAITVKVNDEDKPIDNKLFTSSDDCGTYNSGRYSIASGSATIPNSDLITVCNNDTTIKLSFEQDL